MSKKRISLISIWCMFMATMLYLLLADFTTDEVVVAVLDTGVDEQHPLLEGKVVDGYDFVEFGKSTEDPNGHGTHVAGIIAAIAPEVKIMPVRMINEEDEIKNSAASIMYAILNGANIVNMSYAEQYSFFTKMAISFGEFKGVTFVASSGNSGLNEIFYPAKYSGVISVSGWDERDESIYGNYGEEVNFVAPGQRIVSASLDGGYTAKTGTSMSAAYLSGVVAYILNENEDFSTDDIVGFLDEWSIPVSDYENEEGNRLTNQRSKDKYARIDISHMPITTISNWNALQDFRDRRQFAANEEALRQNRNF